MYREELSAGETHTTNASNGSNIELVVSVPDGNLERRAQDNHRTATVVFARHETTEGKESLNSLASIKSTEFLAGMESKGHFSGTKERVAVGVFTLVLIGSCILSIVALCCRSEGWISSESIESLKIGWRKGCLGEKAAEPSTCTSRSAFDDIEDVLSEAASIYARIAVSLLVAAWILPIAVFLLVNRFQRSDRETCCHGYTISILWSLCGITLLVLGVLFLLSCQSAADETKQRRLDVYCQGLKVCEKVREVSECNDVTCRVTAAGNVHCADHGRCRTTEVHLTCEDDGVVCDLVPDWGLLCLLISSSLMFALGVALGLGSIFIGQDL